MSYSDDEYYSDNEDLYYDSEEEANALREFQKLELQEAEEERKRQIAASKPLNKYQISRDERRKVDEARRREALEKTEFEKKQLALINVGIVDFNEELIIANKQIAKLADRDFTGEDAQIQAESILGPLKNQFMIKSLAAYKDYERISDAIRNKLGYEKQQEIENRYNIREGFKTKYREVLDNINMAILTSKGLNTPRIKRLLDKIFNAFTVDVQEDDVVPEELQAVGYTVSYEDVIESQLSDEIIKEIIDSYRQEGRSDDEIIFDLQDDPYYMNEDDIIRLLH